MFTITNKYIGTDIALYLESVILLTELLLLQNILDHEMIYKRVSRSYRSPYLSFYRLPYRRDSRQRYKSCSYSRDKTSSKSTSSFKRPSRQRDSINSISRSRSNKRKSYYHSTKLQASNDPINFEVNMYHPTEMANTLSSTSWFYSLYTHQETKTIVTIRQDQKLHFF